MRDGREVLSIWFNGAEGDKVIAAQEGLSLKYRSDYHGDHQCEFVDEFDAVGNLTASHNVRYIASINWGAESE